jgi:hypothetical protein
MRLCLQIVPIEIESATKGFLSLQIGFNRVEKPIVVAEAFCEKHDLPPEYIQQIAFFLEANCT